MTVVPLGDTSLIIRSAIQVWLMVIFTASTSVILPTPESESVEVMVVRSRMSLGTSVDVPDTWHTGVLVRVGVRVGVDVGGGKQE